MKHREFFTKFISNKSAPGEQTPPNKSCFENDKTINLNRREFLEKIAKVATMLGLSSVIELFSGCSLLNKKELSKLLSKRSEQMSLEQIESILQEIPLYVELTQNPSIKIELKESEEISEKMGALAGWAGGFDLIQVKGTLYFYPYKKLTYPIEKENYYSMIYHELVHIKQDWQLFRGC